MRILISGGGTAGHINPALAIADYAKNKANAEILFVGTKNGLESSLVSQAGYSIEFIEVYGLKRKLTAENFVVFLKYLKAISDCKKIIKKFKPDLVVGTGGYVCAPAIKAASCRGIPSIIHEQNVIPGLTVKMCAKMATSIAISFKDTLKYLDKSLHKKCVLTGNPLDEGLLSASYEESRKKLGLDDKPFVVMIGGSLGADRLNEAMIEFVKGCDKDSLHFMSGTGNRYYDKVKQRIGDENLGKNIQILPYIYNRNEVYPAADLIISRAGALSVSEICALGKASILIPSPNVAHNHQEYNAKSVEKIGGAKMIVERHLSNEAFRRAVDDLLKDNEKRKQMGENAAKMGIKDASARIFDIIKNLTDK